MKQLGVSGTSSLMDILGCLLPASIPAPSVALSLGNSPTSVSPPTGPPFSELSYPGITLHSPEDSTTCRGNRTPHYRGARDPLSCGVGESTPARPRPPSRPGGQVSGPQTAPPRLPPAGPKTAGAAAPVAAAARSWRARAAAAVAAASTSNSGCLGQPRRACGPPARPPSRPPRREPPQPQRPAPPERPTQPGPRGAARRLLRSRIPRATPSPPSPARPAQPPVARLRRREGPAQRARVGLCTAFGLAQSEPESSVGGRVLAERGGAPE